MNRRECLMALSEASEMGMDKMGRLLNLLGSPEDFFLCSSKVFDAAVKTVKPGPCMENILQNIRKKPENLKIQDLMDRDEISFITSEEIGFPKKLKNIKDPPLYLFYKGKLKQNAPSIAIIGARNCSPYGKEIATCFAKVFARCGLEVVSGMARGIDGYAHEGALRGNGSTTAVLGFGVDGCYPKENYGLKQRIIENGCLISEYPPGTQGFPAHFPARNRLISGLSDGVLVVEAAQKSGTLITVDFALDQGKNVYAIPGRLGDPLSFGCNELIKNGCRSITDPAEILNDYGIKVLTEIDKDKKIYLDSTEKIVYSYVDSVPRNVNELVEKTGLEQGKVIKALLMLELNGFVAQPVRDIYIRIPD